MSTRGFFYIRIPVSNTAFPSAPQIKLPFQATRIVLAPLFVKQNEIIQFSYLAPNLDGELMTNDLSVAFDGLSEGRIWFRVVTPSSTAEIRVWAWRGGGV